MIGWWIIHVTMQGALGLQIEQHHKAFVANNRARDVPFNPKSISLMR
jgi:hypothetical protein